MCVYAAGSCDPSPGGVVTQVPERPHLATPPPSPAPPSHPSLARFFKEPSNCLRLKINIGLRVEGVGKGKRPQADAPAARTWSSSTQEMSNRGGGGMLIWPDAEITASP